MKMYRVYYRREGQGAERFEDLSTHRGMVAFATNRRAHGYLVRTVDLGWSPLL